MLEDEIIISPGSGCRYILAKYSDDQQANFTGSVSLAAIKRSVLGSEKNERKPWLTSTMYTFKSLSQDTCKCPSSSFDAKEMLFMAVIVIVLIFGVIMATGFILNSLHKTFGFELRWIFRKNSRSAGRRQAVHYRLNDNNDSRVDRSRMDEPKQGELTGE